MSLIPRWYNRLHAPKKGGSPLQFDKFFEDFDEGVNALTSHPSGLSVYSDDKCIYIEADVPGLTAKEIDVSIDSEGVLWIKGEKKLEEKNKKYYRKSLNTFSYCVPLWDEIDEKIEPQATCKDGVMRIVFNKKKEKQVEAKKIEVKEK